MQLQLEVCDLELCHFEECQFLEYRNSYEFNADTQPRDRTLNRDGKEKGALLEVYDKLQSNKVEYIYAPVKLAGSQLTNWIKTESAKVGQDRTKMLKQVTYWRLEVFSCVPVKRDRAWFASRLPVMKEFWKDVIWYRTMGIEQLYEDHNKKMPTDKVDIDGEENNGNQEGAIVQAAFLSDSDVPSVAADEEETSEDSSRVAAVAFLSDSDDLATRPAVGLPPKVQGVRRQGVPRVRAQNLATPLATFLSDSD